MKSSRRGQLRQQIEIKSFLKLFIKFAYSCKTCKYHNLIPFQQQFSNSNPVNCNPHSNFFQPHYFPTSFPSSLRRFAPQTPQLSHPCTDSHIPPGLTSLSHPQWSNRHLYIDMTVRTIFSAHPYSPS